MTKNISVVDRGIRLCLGVICALSAFTRETRDTTFWILIVLGGIAVLTSLLQHCWIYDLLGINTREKK